MKFHVPYPDIPIAQKVEMFGMPSTINAEIIFNLITKIDKVNRP